MYISMTDITGMTGMTAKMLYKSWETDIKQ